jgi:hypothetical protein
MDRSATRRAFMLSLLAGAAPAAKRRIFPSKAVRYSDRLTEFPVDLLTSPAYPSRLSLPSCSAISRHASFLVYSSRRDGSPQLFLLDQKKGVSQRLTDAAALADTEFTLLPGDREVLFIDGDSLRILTLSSLRDRELYRVRIGWRKATWLALTSDGDAAILIETRDGFTRFGRFRWTGGKPKRSSRRANRLRVLWHARARRGSCGSAGTERSGLWKGQTATSSRYLPGR